MTQIKKTLKIEAYVDSNDVFNANGMSGYTKILEYDFAKFIDWGMGELVMSIAGGHFRDVCSKIIMYSHLWFLYGIYKRED